MGNTKKAAANEQAKIAELQQRVDDAENEMRIMRENNKGPEPVSTSKAYKAAYERKTYYKKELLKLKPNKASADMEKNEDEKDAEEGEEEDQNMEEIQDSETAFIMESSSDRPSSDKAASE